MKKSGRRAVLTTIAKTPITRFKKLLIRELLAERFLGDVSMAHLRLPAGTALPNVVHRRTAELVICLSGRMTATLSGKPRRVSAGTLLYIPAGVWHAFRTAAVPCEALALFHPGLTIGPGADIHGRPGIELWT